MDEQIRFAFDGAARQEAVTHKPTARPDYVKQFGKRLLELDRSKTPYEKFRDFCELAYCAHAKRMAGSTEAADRLEARYMQIVGTYRDKDTVRAYPEMMAWAFLAVAEEKQEFLGTVASELELLDTHNSQFFTPYDVSRMMAEMIIGHPDPVIEEQGFITVQEPASGAGGMILAVADVLERRGYDPSCHMLVQATDVSQLCYHMTYLQLAFRGIPAAVIHGNTLSLEQFQSAWTPAIPEFYALHGRLFERKQESAHTAEPKPSKTEPIRIEKPVMPVQPMGAEFQQLHLF
jgi:hypothetical protein